METVIYGDVLLAVNFIINLMLLGLTQRLTGVPVKRFRRYLGALAGAVCAFAIFLPQGGLVTDLFLRLVATILVVGITYLGQPAGLLLRLAAVFFAVGFLFAGFIMGLWFLVPNDLLAIANGIVYFNVTPLLLVGCAVGAYLFVSVFDAVFDRGQRRQTVWQATIRRGGSSISLAVLLDTGNRLVEPFSGLPVLVTGLAMATPLLTEQERWYLAGKGELPPGLRPVFYQDVGGTGLLCAFRPDSLMLAHNGGTVDCDGYVAVSVKAIACHGCGGVFNPRLLGLATTSFYTR
ncbi:MAG: sigma-E processing peptidase SpoIIGA [Angelakisella sp.]